MNPKKPPCMRLEFGVVAPVRLELTPIDSFDGKVQFGIKLLTIDADSEAAFPELPITQELATEHLGIALPSNAIEGRRLWFWVPEETGSEKLANFVTALAVRIAK